MEPSQASARPIEQHKNKGFTLSQIIEGIENLNNLIEEKLKGSDKVYLIALSRKMPRVIHWATHHMHDDELRNRFKETISKCEYTTELALSMIFGQDGEDYSKSSILILDDVIISGETINSACDDVYYITGIKPDFWCFSAYSGARMPEYANQAYVYNTDIIDEVKAAERLKSIVDIIYQFGLPSDIEFPVIHIFIGKTATSLLNKIIQESDTFNTHLIIESLNSEGLTNYALPDNKSEENILKSEGSSFTILTGSYDKEGLKPGSIEKIRIFRDQEELRVALFAPKEFSDTIVKNKQFFADLRYKIVWSSILDKIGKCEPVHRSSPLFPIHKRSAAEYRINRLRAITANYIASISTIFDRFKTFKDKQPVASKYVDDITKALKIEREDLQLLFGDTTALNIVKTLNEIVQNRVPCNIQRNYADLPNTIVPGEFFEKYLSEKYGLIMRATEEDLGRVLLDVMRKSYDIQKKDPLAMLLSSRERLIHESIAGLISPMLMWATTKESLKTLKNKKEIEVFLNKWLDENIDNGNLIPRWQKVEDTSGKEHWRRYYHVSNILIYSSSSSR